MAPEHHPRRGPIHPGGGGLIVAYFAAEISLSYAVPVDLGVEWDTTRSSQR